MDARAIDGLFESADNTSTIRTCTSTETVPDTKRKLRQYERQKYEKGDLKQQIAQLSKLLRQEHTKKKTKATGETPDSHRVWQMLVQRRVESRLASEAHRRWLLRGKTLLIGDLKAVVRQHLKIASLIAAKTQGHETDLFIESTDDLLYAMDIQDINALYTQTDSIFSSGSLAAETKLFLRTTVKTEQGVAVEYRRKQQMMFSFDQTCASMWMLSNHVHRQLNREEFDNFDDPEMTQAAKFRVTRCVQGQGQASLKQRIVTRRFMEENRMVTVWKSFVAGESCRNGRSSLESASCPRFT